MGTPRVKKPIDYEKEYNKLVIEMTYLKNRLQYFEQREDLRNEQREEFRNFLRKIILDTIS